MTIICFEGASAVGKTTVAKSLRGRHNAYVIPEVNLLFGRTGNESQFWYFERQVERWKLAVNALKTHALIILDGDPFQPLWYNWAYDFDILESLEKIAPFYRSELAAGKIDFPDKYFIFSIETDELRKRKINDTSRTRKNFERHLRFIEPQRDFFNFVKSINNNLVEFVENREIETTVEKIFNSIEITSNKNSSLELFDAIIAWLNSNKAN